MRILSSWRSSSNRSLVKTPSTSRISSIEKNTSPSNSRSSSPSSVSKSPSVSKIRAACVRPSTPVRVSKAMFDNPARLRPPSPSLTTSKQRAASVQPSAPVKVSKAMWDTPTSPIPPSPSMTSKIRAASVRPSSPVRASRAVWESKKSQSASNIEPSPRPSPSARKSSKKSSSTQQKPSEDLSASMPSLSYQPSSPSPSTSKISTRGSSSAVQTSTKGRAAAPLRSVSPVKTARAMFESKPSSSTPTTIPPSSTVKRSSSPVKAWNPQTSNPVKKTVVSIPRYSSPVRSFVKASEISATATATSSSSSKKTTTHSSSSTRKKKTSSSSSSKNKGNVFMPINNYSPPAAPRKKSESVSSRPVRKQPDDWEYLHRLQVRYSHYKAQIVEEKKRRANAPPPPLSDSPKEVPSRENVMSKLTANMGESYTANGNWVDHAFIDRHLHEDTKYQTLTFRFNDPKLFKRFDKTDSTNRKVIIEKFVQALVTHPRSHEITEINLFRCLLPDPFCEELARVMLENPSYLANLQVLQLESNVLGEDGVVALSKVVAHPDAWRYLQVLKLDNQKYELSLPALEALANAIVTSPSLVVCSSSVRAGLQREQINNTIAANVDVLRQARRKHALQTGTLKRRKRNEMEQFFDKVAANDSSITDIDLVGNIKFMGLSPEETAKAALSLAHNVHVKTVKLVKMKLDDNFARALAQALETNNTIEKVNLDGNAISAEGIKTLFTGLAKNSCLQKLQVRHQSRSMSSAEEEDLPQLLEANRTLIRVGIDFRNPLIKAQLDKKTSANREYQRKLRAKAKKQAEAVNEKANHQAKQSSSRELDVSRAEIVEKQAAEPELVKEQVIEQDIESDEVSASNHYDTEWEEEDVPEQESVTGQASGLDMTEQDFTEQDSETEHYDRCDSVQLLGEPDKYTTEQDCEKEHYDRGESVQLLGEPDKYITEQDSETERNENLDQLLAEPVKEQARVHYSDSEREQDSDSDSESDSISDSDLDSDSDSDSDEDSD